MRILRCLPYAVLIALTAGFGLREFSWQKVQRNWQAETAEREQANAAQVQRIEALQLKSGNLAVELEALHSTLRDKAALIDQRDQQIRLWQNRTEEMREELDRQAVAEESLRSTLRNERADWLRRERERRQAEQLETLAMQQELAELRETLRDCQRLRTAPVAFAEVRLQGRSAGQSMLALERPEDFHYQRDRSVLLRNQQNHWTTAWIRDATAEFLLLELAKPNEFGDTLVKVENLIMVWPTES